MRPHTGRVGAPRPQTRPMTPPRTRNATQAQIPDAFPADAVHVVSVSGGKDSTCAYLLAIELLGPTGFDAVFADTGWEHADTYQYIEELPARAGGPPIRRVAMDPPTDEQMATRRRNLPRHFEKRGVHDPDRIADAQASVERHDNPFRNLTMMKGVFPSGYQRLCTAELKITPIHEQVYNPIRESGRAVVNWQGTRADESPSRALLPEHQELWKPRLGPDAGRLFAWRPLLRWTLDDVKAYARSKGVGLNPLYVRGFTRVGCYPCVFARKKEIALLARLSPERIDEIADWETDMSRRNANDVTFFDRPIHDTVAWAESGEDHETQVLPGLEELFRTSCEEWGACES